MNKQLKILSLSLVTICTLFSCACNKKTSKKTEEITQTLKQDSIKTESDAMEKPESKQTFGGIVNTETTEKSALNSVKDSLLTDTKITKDKNANTDIDLAKNEAKQGEARKIGDNDTKTDNKKNSGFGPVVTPTVNPNSEPIVPKKPPVIIYKMKADYSNNIPVILSADKKSVIRYPAPGDLFFEGKISRPTALANGFYLDNRGVNENVAFVSFTYDDYLNFKKAPTAEELFNAVIDDNPLLEIYQLKDIGRSPEELNKVIEMGNLKENYVK